MLNATKRVVLVGLTVLLALDAHAITTTGRIDGVVLDPTGLPVDGAEVSATSPQLIGGARKINTSADGEFRFLDLAPGTYAITVKADGFRETRQEGIVVSLGQTVQVDIVLEPPVAATQEAFVVTAAPSTVDTERVQMGTTVNSGFLGRVASSSRRDYQSVAEMAPGVHDSDPTNPGNPVIHGSSGQNNQYLLDGINMTDPVTNTFSRNFNFDAMEDVEVLTGGRDAEYGSAQGGIINIVTKSGGNEFTADGSIYITPDTSELTRRRILSGGSPYLPEGLGPYRRDDKPRRYFSNTANLNLGGPIIKDKLWFYVSNQLSYYSQQLSEDNVFPGVGRHPAREFRAYYGLGKLTYQATSWQRFQVLIQGDPTSISNTTQEITTHPSAEEHQNQGGGLVSLSSDTTLGEQIVFKNKLALFSSYIQAFPENENFDTPAQENITMGTLFGSTKDLYRDTRNRIQLTSQVVISWDKLLGQHETKFGLDGMFAWNRVYRTIPGGYYYRDTGVLDDPSQRGTPQDIATVVSPQNAAINGDTLGLYVQDVWKPFRSLTIRPGLRFDTSRMRNDRAGGLYQLIATPSANPAGWMQEQVNAFGNVFDATIVQLNTLSPRLGVAWDPFNDGRTNLHAGVFRYTDTSYLSYPQAIGRSQRTRFYTYNAATGQYDQPGREEGGEAGFKVKPELSGFNPRRLPTAKDVDLSNPLTPSIQGWDPLQIITGHHAPKTDEIVFGVSRELMDGVSLSVDGVGRLVTNIYEDDELNLIWNQDGSNVVDGRNGQKDVIFSLGTPDAAYQIYYGVDVMLRKRLTDRFEGMISYAFGVDRGTTNNAFSEAFDREKQFKYLFGYLEYDRRHVLRLMGYYHFPLGFTAGGQVSYLSGLPYNKFYQNAFYGDYADLRANRGYDPDHPGRELRLPDIVETDLRFMWDAEELTKQKLWLILDVENALNLRTPTQLEERNLPEGSPTRYEQVLNRQKPIQFTFGVRFQY